MRSTPIIAGTVILSTLGITTVGVILSREGHVPFLHSQPPLQKTLSEMGPSNQPEATRSSHEDDTLLEGLRLKATIVSSDTGQSRALIQHEASESRVFSIGDTVTPRLILVEIQKDRVQLSDNGHPTAKPLTLHVTYDDSSTEPGEQPAWTGDVPENARAARGEPYDPTQPWGTRKRTGIYADTPEGQAWREAVRESIRNQAKPAETTSGASD